jgi:hypothetical protein
MTDVGHFVVFGGNGLNCWPFLSHGIVIIMPRLMGLCFISHVLSLTVGFCFLGFLRVGLLRVTNNTQYSLPFYREI